jgi:hypothetical protein
MGVVIYKEGIRVVIKKEKQNTRIVITKHTTTWEREEKSDDRVGADEGGAGET